MGQTITVVPLNAFGSAGSSTYFGQIGSKQAGTPLNTKSLTAIQSLSAFLQGWQACVYASNNAPFLEEMNAMDLLINNYLRYMQIEGIPEWLSGVTYDMGSIIKSPYTGSTGVCYFYLSLTDANTGNALPAGAASNASWQFLFAMSGTGLITPGVTNGSNAPVGMIGEYVTSGAVSGGGSTSNTWYNITNITLTPGDWDLSASILVNTNGGTMSQNMFGAISAYSGSTTTDHVPGDNQLSAPAPTGASVTNASVSIVNWRQSLTAASTNFFAKGYSVYTIAGPVWYTRLSARRIR